MLAGWQAGAWLVAANNSAQTTASMRDEALREARALIVPLESIDYRNPDEALDRRESLATGSLLAQFQSTRSRYADQIRQTQATTTATVVDAAVTDLDTSGETASVLLFVDLSTTQHKDGQQSGQSTQRQRLKLQITRTDDGWKASQADSVGSGS